MTSNLNTAPPGHEVVIDLGRLRPQLVRGVRVRPVVGSALLGVLFLGSAAIGRPVTVRLAQDFVSLPAHLFHHDGIRRLFTQVTVAWGVSRLLDAGRPT